jgi:hypothetical protein
VVWYLVFRGEVRRKPGCGLRMRMRMADMCWAMGLPLFAIEDRELLLWARAPGGGGGIVFHQPHAVYRFLCCCCCCFAGSPFLLVASAASL